MLGEFPTPQPHSIADSAYSPIAFSIQRLKVAHVEWYMGHVPYQGKAALLLKDRASEWLSHLVESTNHMIELPAEFRQRNVVEVQPRHGPAIVDRLTELLVDSCLARSLTVQVQAEASQPCLVKPSLHYVQGGGLLADEQD